MSDPMARQAATLAALDLDAYHLSGHLGRIKAAAHGIAGGQEIAAAADRLIAGFEGRRSILDRHAPVSISWAEVENWEASSCGLEPGRLVLRSAVVCVRCSDVEEDTNGNLTHGDGGFTPWEDCPDWRDAAAGLEVPDA